ncbi:hypothetical protein [Flavobacterium soyae]|uniref:hypothetical protein n=1 Tax=Flavobacterium soyae TaxID=2903098 RepID=UPI001E2F1492|nr:hypothetical protein [Flavobacterium soyae]MCD9573456.1 hypothetical protein [Flavobacterium soyae]
MKNLLYLFIITIVFSQSSYSQGKYDWKSIQKVELYSIKKNDKSGELISSKYFNKKNLVECQTEDIIKSLKDLKKYKYDVLTEKESYALRVFFKKSHADFLVFPEQGVMFNKNEYFTIAKKANLKS